MINRHKAIDLDCPHGGPFLTDAEIDFCYNTIERIEKLAWSRANNGAAKLTFGLGSRMGQSCDFNLPNFGTVRSTVSRMQNYISLCEAELRWAGLLPPLQEQLQDAANPESEPEGA